MYYGVDLADVYSRPRRMSLRKAGVLIEHLPPESATMTAIRLDSPEPSATDTPDPMAPARDPWSSDRMLVAQVVDEIRLLRYSVDCFAAGKEAGKIPPPENVMRPGIKPKENKQRKLLSSGDLTLEQRRKLDPRLQPGTGHTF